jgi:hypothetical protein
MQNVKVLKIESGMIIFEDGITMTSNHDSDCCEIHELNFDELELDEFKDLKFDLSNDQFFRRIRGYGIELMPIEGHSVRIAGHGYNNGYYSDELELVLSFEDGTTKVYDVTECQHIQ